MGMGGHGEGMWLVVYRRKRGEGGGHSLKVGIHC